LVLQPRFDSPSISPDCSTTTAASAGLRQKASGSWSSSCTSRFGGADHPLHVEDGRRVIDFMPIENPTVSPAGIA
jgi:hypothetical protein